MPSGHAARCGRSALACAVVVASVPAAALALAEPPAEMASAAAIGSTSASSVAPTTASVTPIGYVEAYYAYNLNRPSNGITNFRAFDNRSNSFTLSNAAIGASWQAGDVSGRIVLQVGATPSAYYASEPTLAGASGANASGPELWKYLQEVNVGYKAPIGRGLLVQAGLFLSPIGPEVVPIKDNWNWSRSSLFYALPFYHVGVRATYELVDGLSATAAIYNGWNNVVDANEAKSVAVSLAYKRGFLSGQLLYFGGIERATGAPEGPYWRHDLDAYAQVDAGARLSFLAHANAGLEPGRFGVARWAAGALYARVKTADWLYVVARGDRFYEDVPSNASGRATPIFWPVAWVSSATLTLDARPRDFIAVRLEYRHDQADGPIYFRSNVQGDGSVSSPFIANANSQDTLTLGVTSWF